MQRRDRERVPLPRQRARPGDAGGGDLAVGRDRRHARRAQARAGRSARSARSRSATSPSSAMMRETRLRFLTRAGVEIGVASTKAFTTQLAALFLLALTLAKLRGRLPRRTSRRTCKRAAPPADGARRGAGARAADHRLGGALRAEGARAVPRPRPALPDRAGRRAQAEGDLLHPRRGLSGGRAQARAARAGDRARCRW